ncbi:MAG: methyltransferase domain-containing protein [Bacteroidetes bacterium]|nr:methyltransferase domain-containing protein [Bacteroidota bacterium]
MTNLIDNPKINDNRNYDYTNFKSFERREFEIISDFVKPNSKVLDLACGNGSLLLKLKRDKNITEFGIDISKSGINICKLNNINASLGKIDNTLPFENNSFDYAICNVTIQMVMYPEILLREMKRVSKYQIISFPNFGFYKNRFEMFFKGRFPQYSLFGFKWYNTGHIHQLSIKDFENLVCEIGDLKIIKQEFILTNNFVKNNLIKTFPNLFALQPIYLLEKS